MHPDSIRLGWNGDKGPYMRSLIAGALCVAIGSFLCSEAFAESPPAMESTSSKEVSSEDISPSLQQFATNTGQVYGVLEKELIVFALEEKGLVFEPSPKGKTVDAVYVVNNDVFLPQDGIFLRLFNAAHVTTKEEVVARELLLGVGDMWNTSLVIETERRLRNPLFSSAVAIAPVKGKTPSTVGVLVVTRDIWSLRLNSDFELQDGVLSFLTISVAENNFFGRRKQAAAVFHLDQATYAMGPFYFDSNVAGKRLQMSIDASAIFNRDTSDFEGSQSSLVLEKPLWQLASRFAWDVRFSHRTGFDRTFQQRELRLYDAPETAAVDNIPYEFERSIVDARASITHARGTKYKQNFSVGYHLRFDESQLEDPSLYAQAAVDSFRDNVLPRSETSSGITMWYNFFAANFAKYTNIETLAVSEDKRLGPSASVSLEFAPKFLGSDNNFIFAGVNLGWSHGIVDGYLEGDFSVSTRLGRNGFVDNSFSASTKFVSPTIGRWGRLVARITAQSLFRSENNAFFIAGGITGLRGYSIGAFVGDRRVLGNIEYRSQSIPLWITRAAWVAFVDAGHAADTWDQIDIQGNAGVGIRWLIPQLNSGVYRFDWAAPFAGDPLPGRFILSFLQAF